MQSHELLIVQFVSRLAVGAASGRQSVLRGNRVSAALFALIEPALGVQNSQRVISNIVTGVGFLAAGVILRSGANVIGLNTGATIWATAIGAVSGVGLFEEAAWYGDDHRPKPVLNAVAAAIDARTRLKD